MCLFLKNILKQDKQSQIFQFFELQLNNPVKGDWVSTCIKDLQELGISESFEEIKNMKRNKYNNLIKSRIEKNALVYLQSKRGSKGQEIEYTSLEMSTYLLPINSKLTIEEKRKMFSIRNRMIRIAHNFGGKDEKCVCGAIETMSHIYYCESLNEKKPNIIYNELYNGNLNNQIQIYRRLETNIEKVREIKTKHNFPCDLSDPLDCH